MLTSFLQELFCEGNVTVSSKELKSCSNAESEEILTLIQNYEQNFRLTCPGTPPPLTLSVSIWAAELLYQSCRFLVCREIEQDIIQKCLSSPCPEKRSPSTDYSADLILHFLPDLFNLAKRLAKNDPLVTKLKEIATAWPLSSVGISDIEATSIHTFWENPSLRTLYIDRIIETNDISRLHDLAVLNAVRKSLGAEAYLSSYTEFLSPLSNKEHQS